MDRCLFDGALFPLFLFLLSFFAFCWFSLNAVFFNVCLRGILSRVDCLMKSYLCRFAFETQRVACNFHHTNVIAAVADGNAKPILLCIQMSRMRKMVVVFDKSSSLCQILDLTLTYSHIWSTKHIRRKIQEKKIPKPN